MRWALLTQARVTAKALDVKAASKEALIASLKAQAKLYPKLKVAWQVKDVKENSFDLYMKASEPKKVVDDFTPGKKINKEQTDLTKEEIDKIQKIDGQYPINSLDFAGRTFDFDLDKNPRMKKLMEERWKKQGLSVAEKTKEFENLSKKYPKGV